MITMKEVIKFAEIKHGEQKDKNGELYVWHLYRVATCFIDDNDEYEIVAWLHDILEDTNTTVDDLLELGVPKNLISAIVILTHNKGQSYEDYIKLICTNKIATRVKLADLHDNLNPARLRKLDTKTQKRLLRKYGTALNLIGLYGQF